MENIEIAQILSAYATLVDIQGERPFRVRAYRQAAQTVEKLSQPIAQILPGGGGLTALPGVGDRMAAHIQGIVETGTLAAFARTQKAAPRSLTELIKLGTLGPKKAKQLYECLGIPSLSERAAGGDGFVYERTGGSQQRLPKAPDDLPPSDGHNM